MNTETKTTTIVKRREGYPCPVCGGSGNNGDGSSAYSMRILPNGDHEITTTHRDPTPCHLCKGSGRVKLIHFDPFTE